MILKAKKTGANSKLLLNSGSKEFHPISHVFFNDLSVIEASVFCEDGPEPNQFVRNVSKRVKVVCEEGLERKQFVKKGLL
jgi:hypothetical protein